MHSDRQSRLRRAGLRVYRELLKRRTTVRIHEAVWPSPQVEVHFLLGLYRSGTTPLRFSLGTHPNIAAPPESDFLVPFLAALGDERGLRGLASLGYDDSHTLAAYRNLAQYFFANYAASLDEQPEVLIDKSPRYVQYASTLPKLFPEATFVLLSRHPFGQIGSATRYLTSRPVFPDFPSLGDGLVVDAATYWNERTRGLLELAEALPSRCVLVRYEDLCSQPEKVLNRIAERLGIEVAACLGSYDGTSFDRGMEGGKAIAHSSFEPAMADPLRGWEDGLIVGDLRDVWAYVENTADALGYASDGLVGPAPIEVD